MCFSVGLAVALMTGPALDPLHPWFQGPVLGGIVQSGRSVNGCAMLFTPANPAAIAAWESLRRNPLDVLIPGSKFAGYTLRRAPRGKDFCLSQLNLAFPKKEDISLLDAVLPSYIEGTEWALEVFARGGLAIEPPPWAPDFGPERKTWPGLVAWRRSLKSASIPTYTPDRTIEWLNRASLPIPPELPLEAEAWRAAGRTR